MEKSFEKRYTEEEAMEEAGKMKEKIETGEAENYEEAEEFVEEGKEIEKDYKEVEESIYKENINLGVDEPIPGLEALGTINNLINQLTEGKRRGLDYLDKKNKRKYLIAINNKTSDYFEIEVSYFGVEYDGGADRWERAKGTWGNGKTEGYRVYKSNNIERVVYIDLPEKYENEFRTNKAEFFKDVVELYPAGLVNPSPGFWLIEPKDNEDLEENWIKTIENPKTKEQIRKVYKEHGDPIILAKGGAYTPDDVPKDVIKRAKACLTESLKDRQSEGKKI